MPRLAGERLLVTSRDWENQEDLVEVAHEALLRHWPMLKDWIASWRGALVTIRQLQADAAMWQAKGKDASYLWSHERVREAAQAIAELRGHWNPSALELEFLGPIDPDKMLGELERPETSHERRALIGDRLALFGDRRTGIGLRPDGLPDIDWVPINGGEVTIEIRKNPDEPKSEVVSRLTRSVASFWMARYPITITQFQAFLGECHRQDGWHLPPGFMVELPADYSPPNLWARYGNQPVDSVNWWDACAFCHWLAARLDTEVWLPTEFEWQQAATGGHATRTYPWGRDWELGQEPWRANTLESELGRSTAVGMYPAGASPAGVVDMAGTLWEWCSNAFDDPDDTAPPASQEDRRVLRGGSWLRRQDLARSAYRVRNSPLDRLSNIGFRVVCSSPPTER